MEVRVDVTGFNELETKLQNMVAAIPEEKAEALRWAGEQFVPLMQVEVAEMHVTGALERSISVLEATTDYVVIGPDLDVAPWAEHVAKGGTPHAAPFDKISNWVANKPGLSIPGKDDTEKTWKVWWGIKHSGTSQWWGKKYGTGGANPFAERTLNKPEAKDVLRATGTRLGEGIIARLA